MAEVVVVNGISQPPRARRRACDAWQAAVRVGLARAGFPDPETVTVDCTFYADLLGSSRPAPTASGEGDAEGLVHIGEDLAGRRTHRTPALVQRALGVIGRRSRLWSDLLVFGIAPLLLNPDLRQVRRYFTDRKARLAVRDRLAETIAPDTSVLVGHSLGSVVAYEALSAHPEWPVRTLVTLGSPLGIPKLISNRLEPPPHKGLGRWPGRVDTWVNVADAGDVTALVKRLAPSFGPAVQDLLVHNGRRAHDLGRYLTAPETGHAIASSLRHLVDALPLAVRDPWAHEEVGALLLAEPAAASSSQVA